MGSTDALSFPCPNYFFKSPGLDQEGSAYGDETVRYFKFQKWNFKSKEGKMELNGVFLYGLVLGFLKYFY